MDATLPNGLILVSQPEQIGITPKEMVDVLPGAYKALPRETLDFDMVEIARQAIRTRDWGPAQRALEERFLALARLREKHPDYRLVYFGSSPIPLAVHLGFLIETWLDVEVVPHHHIRRAWGWFPADGVSPARLVPPSLPDYRDRTEGEAVIRVSTSHLVDPQVTRRVVANPLVEIDLSLERPAEDAFSRPEEMTEVARAFRKSLDVIGDQLPGVQRVHLFAAVQPGMALLLGAQISKTMHPPVQTYQYARNAQSEPFHLPAVLVNGPRRPEPQPISEQELARAARDRELLAQDLERMNGLAAQERERGARSRFPGALKEGRAAFTGPWQHLPALHETPLGQTEVDVERRAVDDSFRLEPTLKKWQLDDHWLARLTRRLPEETDRMRSLRLLVLHELAHRGPQTLTSESSKGIGRFPKVLEEMDYQADVWAMVYEYVLARTLAPRDVADPRRFFTDLVKVATETMWAFDDDGQPLREIQIRRLNRYLIWYWQYLRLEQGAGAGKATTLETVLEILADRPIIELAGPTVVAHDERVFFALDGARGNVPEIAIYHDGKLFRHGTRIDFPIEALLAGTRTCDGEKILGVLRAAFEPTVRMP